MRFTVADVNVIESGFLHVSTGKLEISCSQKVAGRGSLIFCNESIYSG